MIYNLQGRSIPLPDSAQPADERSFFLFLSHFQFAVCRFLQSIPDGTQGLGGIDIGQRLRRDAGMYSKLFEP